MATGPPTVGPKPPLVILPMAAAARVADLAHGRGPARGPRAGCRPACAAAPSRELAQNDVGAGETAFARAGACRCDQVEPGFDRRRGLVDVVAVEAEPGLEPQRIARAEPDAA